MGDLKVGDQVFDEGGNICNVIAATDVMTGHDCFMVKFSDGAEIVADADHVWKTHAHASGKQAREITANGTTLGISEWSRLTGISVGTIWARMHVLGWNQEEAVGLSVKSGIGLRRSWRHDYERGPQKNGLTRRSESDNYHTTRQIAESLAAMPNGTTSQHPQAKWNHRVDVAESLQLPDANLPIPPYTLGVWLGDGDSDCARITLSFDDWQTVDEIKKDGIPVKSQKPHSETTARVSFSDGGMKGSKADKLNTVSAKLRLLGLYGNKHIPGRYLRASRDQRLSLLQGIVDTDGYISPVGDCEITLCNERLSGDVAELIRTLGYKCTIRESDAKMNGITVGRRWRMMFKAYQDCPPARLERKKAMLSNEPQSRPLSSGRMIVGCDPIPSVPVRCISVDSPSQMYLASREMVPTHNSPLAGGIGLYCLAFDDEPGAEIYAAAVTREQAGITFRDARTFAEKSESLREMLIIDKHNIAYPAENSFFRAVSSEHRGLDGKRPHVALIDEIHEHPNDMVVRKMSAGMKGRRQGLQFEITNSGYDRHSICYQHHEYTEKILEGTIEDDAWFGMMTGLDVCPKCAGDGKTIPQDGCPDCDDWRDEAVWEKANPNLDYLGAPFRDYLRRQVEEAKAMPSQENIVKRLNFCIWTESITRWIQADKWNACSFPVDPEALKGRACYGGLDLSSNLDLTAWVKVFPPEEDGGRYEILCNFFLPEDNMRERVHRDKVPYDVWARQGFITLTPGDLIDYAFILDQIRQDTENFHIAELAFDRWGSQKITTDLQDLGFEIKTETSKAESTGMALVQFGQGFASMAAPVKEVEKMVIGKELAHGGNPVLTWMV
ncbi:MAG: terminase TerL endonuclease subunit, partial [Pseudomonadota bacterium]